MNGGKKTKHYKNKLWRAAELHLVNVFKVPEFTESKFEVLNLDTLDLYLFSQNEIQLATILVISIFYILDCHSEKSFYETVQVFKKILFAHL